MHNYKILKFQRYFLIVLVLFSCASLSEAQGLQPVHARKGNSGGVEISGMYGYGFGGQLNGYKGDLSIMDSDSWGATISIPVQRGIRAVLAFYRQDSHLDIRYYSGGYSEQLFDMAVEYYQIGAIRELRTGKAIPYGMFTAGAVRFAPRTDLYDDEWKFAVTLGLGVKFNLNNRFGLRIQGQMLMPVMWAGGSLWCGTGGCSAGISSGSVVLQGSILGGLYIKL